MPTSIANIVGMRHVDYTPMLPDPTLLLPDCYIGVEMELEGDTRGSAMHHPDNFDNRVVAKTDGSLRNGGVELVFSEPLLGDAALKALRWMFKVKDDCGLVGSIRTSTHVHINYSSANDTGETLVNTVVTWLLVEKAMALTAGHHREYNSFCVPSYMLSPSDENIIYGIATVDCNNSYALNDAVNRAGHVDRYTALNLSALLKYGTLECRLLGTADYEATLNWINLLLGIKRTAQEYTRDALLSYDSLASFLTGTMPEVADLLIVNSDAESQYQRAKTSILSALNRVPAVTNTTERARSMADELFENAVALNVHRTLTTGAGLTMVYDDTPAPPVADDVFNVTRAIEGVAPVLLDSAYFLDNTSLGVDTDEWEGPDALATLELGVYSDAVRAVGLAAENVDVEDDLALRAYVIRVTEWMFGTSLDVLPVTDRIRIVMRLTALCGYNYLAQALGRVYPDLVNIH